MSAHPTTPFNLPAVEAAISHTSFAGHLHHLPSAPSTQTLALEAARAGARHGVWIADQQTAGRGRGNHTWHSPAGAGLLLSALITPPIPLPAANHLSLAVALACQAAIAEITGFRPRTEIDIRWPNDLLLRGPHSSTFRKLGGILIESATAATPSTTPLLRYAVLGIGINVNHLTFPPDLDPIATSLRRESPDPATPLPREPLLAALLRHLDTEIHGMVQGTQPARDLTRFSSWIHGKPVTVPPDQLLAEGPANRGYTGTTAGLTPEGFLRILAPDGTSHIVRSGGVRERPTPTA